MPQPCPCTEVRPAQRLGDGAAQALAPPTTPTPTLTRGASLIEVLVAMAILVIVLSSTAGLLSFGAERMGHALRNAECERIAASHVETLLRSADPPTTGSVRFNREGRVDDNGPYTSRWTVDTNHPIRGAARLVLTVDGGMPHQATITTYLLLRSRR